VAAKSRKELEKANKQTNQEQKRGRGEGGGGAEGSGVPCSFSPFLLYQVSIFAGRDESFVSSS
jgi:hypothetical protein